MTVRQILKMGDPRLLRMARPVTQFDTDELHLLLADMQDTMSANDGVGLAAPQIGVDLQVVVFGNAVTGSRYPHAPPIPRTALINPTLTLPDDGGPLAEDWEGCLSLPGLRGKVPRFDRIHYSGFDPFGDAVSQWASGFHARVVQHECDHLVGKLYPMRIRDFTQFGFACALGMGGP